MSPASPKRRPWLLRQPWLLENAGVLALFTLLTVAMTWPLAANLRTHLADVGVNDPLFYARLLRHFLAWLSGAHPRLFDVDYFWPHPNVLATTDASFGILYCALPFLLFTRDLFTLVNLGVLVTFVLTGHSTYLVARELTRSRTAALVAGVAFAFCFFRLHQLDHLNVLQMQWMGYALYAMWRLREKPTWALTGWTALAFFLHGSAGTNDALYSLFLFAAVGLWLVLSAERERRFKIALHLAAAVAISGAFLWPIYGPYLEMKAAHSLTWPEWHVDVYGGRLEQLTAAPPYSKTYAEHAKELGRESYTFLGYAVLLSAAIGALLLRLNVTRKPKERVGARRWVLTIAATGATVALISPALSNRWLALALVTPVILWELARGLWRPEFDRRASLGLLLLGVGLFYLYAGLGPHIQSHGQVIGEGLWRWLAHLPGFGSVRTPARFWFVVSFAAALLAGVGVAQLEELIPKRWARTGLALLVFCAVLFEMRVAPLPLRAVYRIEQAPAVYTWIAQQPGHRPVLELPFFDPLERYRMYQTTLFDRPLLGGEAGYRPPLAEWMKDESFSDGSALQKLRTLRASGIEFVLLYNQLLGPRAQLYRGVIEGAGARYVTNIAGVDVYDFPETVQRPFTTEYARATLGFSPAPEGGLKATVDFTATTPDAVFQFATRKLKLHVRTEQGSSDSASVYLSPPLIVPGSPLEQRVVLDVPLQPGAQQVTYKLTDEAGTLWAEGTTSVSKP